MTEQELKEWAALGRSITDDDRVRHEPPAHIWDNIAATIAAETSDQPKITDSPPMHEAPAAEPLVVPAEPQEIDAPIDLRAERARRSGWSHQRNMLLAGAAAVLLFFLGFSVLTADDPVPTFAAEVTNATLPESFSGVASAIVEVDDSPMLEINFDGALPSDEPVELWLIKPDLSDMRSLGIVKADAETWSGDWPADLDPNEYSLVDLSIEPDDGDPTHSGRSILRGQLLQV